MDIELLKHKRAFNVQEQNAVRKHSLWQEARYWREQGVPQPIQQLLLTRGMKAEQGIFIHYVQDELGGSTDEGMFVDISGCIYEFDVDLSANRTTLLAVYVFRDITQQCEINPRKRGSGATWAYLALQVLQDLGTASD